MEKRRVVITGMGAITPIGNTVEESGTELRSRKWKSARSQSSIPQIIRVKIAAEVKDFVAKERMDFKSAKRMEAFSQYAIVAATEAMEDAGLKKERKIRTVWA